MAQEGIHYIDWKTGEEEIYHPPFSILIHKTNLICPFDNTPILDGNSYHNEHDFFCPNCWAHYPTINQEGINDHARKKLRKCEDELNELKDRESDLEARIKHAKDVGLIPK